MVEENIDPDAENQSDGNHTDDNDSNIFVGEGPTLRLHCRKLLTYQRDVYGIDSALDEDNYGRFKLPDSRVYDYWNVAR